MPGEEKQLPSLPPEDMKSRQALLKHTKGSTNGNQHSSGVSNGRRSGYGVLTNGNKGVDTNDDLAIRLLAQKALVNSQNSHILNYDEVEDLKNVCPWEVLS